MKARTEVALSDVLGAALDRLRSPAQEEWRTLTEAWPQLVGPRASRHSQPFRIANQVLYVIVDDSMWVFELSHRLKLPILHQLKKHFGPEKIRDVHFRVGELRQP